MLPSPPLSSAIATQSPGHPGFSLGFFYPGNVGGEYAGWGMQRETLKLSAYLGVQLIRSVDENLLGVCWASEVKPTSPKARGLQGTSRQESPATPRGPDAELARPLVGAPGTEGAAPARRTARFPAKPGQFSAHPQPRACPHGSGNLALSPSSFMAWPHPTLSRASATGAGSAGTLAPVQMFSPHNPVSVCIRG